MIQHSEYGSIHVLHNNDAKHYEYFVRERREEIVTGKAKETEGIRGAMKEEKEVRQGTEDRKTRMEGERGYRIEQT
eukprot:1407581-Pleurochrysis_carterae.AAC.1